MTSLTRHLAFVDREQKERRNRASGVDLSATATRTPYRRMVGRCVCAVFAMTLMGGVVPAGEIFFDDFSDGSVTNDVPTTRSGIPVRWTATDQPGIRDASSGDFVVTAVPTSEDFISTDFLDVIFDDTSIRARVTCTSPSLGGIVGIAVRNQDAVDTQNYHAGIVYRPDYGGSLLFLGRRDSAAPEDYVFLDTHVLLPFDIRTSDAMLQLDAIGDELKVWAWQPSDPMPTNPQLIGHDSTYGSGFVRMFVGSGLNNDNTGSFRFVQVGDTHVPEPSSCTLLLAALGFVGLVAWRHRHST